MQKMLKWGWVLGLLALGTAQVQAEVTYGSVRVTEVRSIYDGDTLKVTIAGWPAIVGQSIGVRIAGIDTPEMKGKCLREKELARQAKQFSVARLRAGKVVELRDMQRDKYFRILADVVVDGRSLGQELIRAGLATAYDGGTKRSWCNRG